MNILYSITSILFFIWIIRNILFWVSLWQIKEYRLDRVLIHLRETGQGRRLFFSPLSILKWIAFLFYILIVFNGRYIFISQIFVTAIFTIQALFVLKEIYDHSYKRPVLTVKTLIILFLTLGIVSLFFFIPLFESFLWLVFLDKISHCTNPMSSPTSNPMIIAAKKFSTLRRAAALLPKYLISRGRVTTPTIIKVVMNVATMAYEAPCRSRPAAMG